MHRLILLLVAMVLLVGCDPRESKDMPYCGDPNATSPYLEETELWWDPGNNCDNMGCTYFMYGTVRFHNPTDEPYTADVRCYFWDDNYQIGHATLEGVTVDASRTKELSNFREQWTTPDTAYLRLECELR